MHRRSETWEAGFKEFFRCPLKEIILPTSDVQRYLWG